jgi:hypothetical protein
MITEEQMKKWTAQARSLPRDTPRFTFPINILTGEALDVVRFCQRNWEPTEDPEGNVIRPGLVSAVGNGTFTDTIVSEIRELLDAFQEAQNRYRLLIDAKGPNPMERGQFILSEIRSVLDWLFDDGKIDQADAQLAALRRAHDGAQSQDDVAGALHEYAALAGRHRAQLDGLGGFDVSLIDETPAAALALRERSSGPAEPVRPAVTEALELRNRLGAMLLERMQRARAAARFVFRGHPDLIRKVTSHYARAQRAAQRARLQEDDTVESSVATTTEAEEAPASV